MPWSIASRRAQRNFKHYKDLWRLDLERHAWELLPGKGGPAGRSGHRMALHRNRLIVFGGFNDSGKASQCARSAARHPARALLLYLCGACVAACTGIRLPQCKADSVNVSPHGIEL